MKIAYSFGIIDLLHYGHINALSEAKKNVDLHFFGLVSDDASKNWLGEIVSNFEERFEVLNQIKSIDKVIPQLTLDPTENLKAIMVDYPDSEITLFHGDNWKIMLAEDYIKSIGGKLVFTKYYSKLTPENILAVLKNKSNLQPIKNKIISTKANTLNSLKSKLNHSQIEDTLVIQINDYLSDQVKIINQIKSFFKNRIIVVRSSSSNEDELSQSNAGHYYSALNVNSKNENEIQRALESVIESYKKDLIKIDLEQILIQSQTEDVKFSGVVFTRDIHENRPYYLINYDDNGSTDSVTDGSGGKTLWISQRAKYIPKAWKNLIKSIKEIETILVGMILDIEFAIKNSGEVVIFQVRPLAANYKFKKDNNDEEFFETLENVYQQLDAIPKTNGNIMMLSDMAFWNPSEIIGSNPRNLDYSLYREIITKTSWNDGLIKLGYNQVDDELMHKIGNKPYISLDYSFKSLIPSSLNESLSKKLVDFYKLKLQDNLTAHDKIEFEIIPSCYNLNSSEELLELLNHDFSIEEVKTYQKAIHKLTHRALNDFPNHVESDLNDLTRLNQKLEESMGLIANTEIIFFEKIDVLKHLLQAINMFGTPQFARQARFAFIARSICQSMIDKGYITLEKFNQFMGSIESIATDFDKDFDRFLNGEIKLEEFNKLYGHLRSGTYDVRSKTYKETDFNFIDKPLVSKVLNEHSQKIIDLDVVSNVVKDLNFGIESKDFLFFLKESFKQREYFKYEFTKALSFSLNLIIELGKEVGISRKDLSYIEITDILAAKHYSNLHEIKLFWETIIKGRREIHNRNCKLVLPEVIMNEKDLEVVFIDESRPNFITTQSIEGETVFVEELETEAIEGKIVVITKADPGFDWIFAKGIKGLITKYGGVASHMAIRCAEFDIPAAIGCGEIIYNFVLTKKEIKIDCKNGKIT